MSVEEAKAALLAAWWKQNTNNPAIGDNPLRERDFLDRVFR